MAGCDKPDRLVHSASSIGGELAAKGVVRVAKELSWSWQGSWHPPGGWSGNGGKTCLWAGIPTNNFSSSIFPRQPIHPPPQARLNLSHAGASNLRHRPTAVNPSRPQCSRAGAVFFCKRYLHDRQLEPATDGGIAFVGRPSGITEGCLRGRRSNILGPPAAVCRPRSPTCDS